MVEQLQMYFQFPFVRYAIVVGVLIALCSSLLGVTLVLKRFSFIGTGLSHVAFGATAIASAMRFTNSFVLIYPVTIAAAILLMRTGQRAKVKGDAALAMISVGSLALGYLSLAMFTSSANLSGDVCAVLFGSTSILTLTPESVRMCIGLSIAVTAVFLVCYHKIFAVTFDEEFAEATGVQARYYNLMLSVVIAVVIVLAMNLVGSLLVSALVVFPVMSAVQVFKSFKSVSICTVFMSVVCTALGILAAILLGTPVGATIVAVDIGAFVLFYVAGFIVRRI